MSEALGLKNSLREKLIKPFWNYTRPEHGPGVQTTFEEFMKTRPDGGEILKNNAGEAIGLKDIFQDMGQDPYGLHINNLATRDDDFRYLFGPIIEDIVVRGYMERRDGLPAMWTRLVFAAGVTASQEAIRRTWFKFNGVPVPTAEGETFPEATISQGEETIAWKKKGLTLRLSEEYLRANPLPVISNWLAEVGRIFQHMENVGAVATLVAGDLSTGANAAPIIGVASTSNGIDYVDFTTCWNRGNLIGEDWFVMVSGEAMGNKISAIDEFKERQVGSPQITIVNRPEPATMERYVSSEIPANQVMLVDTSHALRQRVFIPMTVKESARPEDWTKGVTIGYSTAFERIGDKSVVVMDDTKIYSGYGFPSYFVVGGYRS